jgi:hypothetical protein
MLVRPSREGLKVADPARGDYLPAEGREVPESTYWHRRVLTGDVVVVTPSPTEQPARRAVKPAPKAEE